MPMGTIRLAVDPAPSAGKSTPCLSWPPKRYHQNRETSLQHPNRNQQLAEVPEINGYLTAAERAEFKRHAASFDLDVSSLARLLLIRELNLGRLSRLIRQYPTTGPAPVKVTARFKQNPDVKSAFTYQVNTIGVSEAFAAGVVFRAELSERWLSEAVGCKGLTPRESHVTSVKPKSSRRRSDV